MLTSQNLPVINAINRRMCCRTYDHLRQCQCRLKGDRALYCPLHFPFGSESISSSKTADVNSGNHGDAEEIVRHEKNTREGGHCLWLRWLVMLLREVQSRQRRHCNLLHALDEGGEKIKEAEDGKVKEIGTCIRLPQQLSLCVEDNNPSSALA